MAYESNSDTSCNWSTRYCHQKIDELTGGLWKKRLSRDHANDSIIKIPKILKRIMEN